MAEESGFFESLPTGGVHGDGTPEYDREYYAAAFAKYFSLFVSNGVFASPAGQLMVVAVGTGLKVKLRPGFAYIKGYWYQNDDEIIFDILANTITAVRRDSIKVRLDLYTREIAAYYAVDDTDVLRTEYIYELKLAEIAVQRSALVITDSSIADTRPDSAVCGFVKGLAEIMDVTELFRQYNAVFQEWFDTVKGQLTADMAHKIAQMIGTMADLLTSDKDNLVGAINSIVNIIGDINNLNTKDKATIVAAINSLVNNAGDLTGLNTTNKGSLVAAINELLAKFAGYLPLTGGTIDNKDSYPLNIKNGASDVINVGVNFYAGSVRVGTFLYKNSGKLTCINRVTGVTQFEIDNDKANILGSEVVTQKKDFLLPASGVNILTFTSKVATVSDTRITTNSLADVYFTSDTIAAAEKADISVETLAGKVQLTAKNAPAGTIKASIHIRTP